MGGLCCKTRSGTSSPLLQANTSSQLTAHLSSYEDSCKEDEKLQSFDATLHERTDHVIKILADGVELRSLGSLKEVSNSVEIRSLGSFKEVTNCLLEMSQDVVKVILESKEDIWDNPELYDLVQEYFKRSIKTMEFCTALGSCLERAKNSQLIIQLAIKQFEEEVEMKDGAVDKKFEKTLEGLQKFKAAGGTHLHPSSSLFMKQCMSNRYPLVAAAVVAPPVVTALAGAMAVPVGSVGNWCNTLWNRYETALKEEKGLVRSIEVGTSVTIEDMVNIRVLVNKFQVEIESLLHNADFAIREEDAVKLVIDVIKRKMAGFMESIEALAFHAGKCHADIIAARRVILNRILKDADR
ncbi:UPF0496 PROTEIN 3-RELATED [Salix purpurea]|uniref:UPF0496 PROTEIN 3-RELATED n=1 Tax=Salix purpurea TaxID=77065 RepID=A0A9Q0V117_SALPP|nr:UPF0496 PROTEIN 3-RELATED [Salix purpurea]